MNGAKVLAFILIMSMLTACGGGPRPQIDERFDRARQEQPEEERHETTYEDTVDATVAEARAEREHHEGQVRRHDDHHHHHDEPSPETQHFAEAALITTGAIFVCSFVVVVLNGNCQFGLGFGYHYY